MGLSINGYGGKINRYDVMIYSVNHQHDTPITNQFVTRFLTRIGGGGGHLLQIHILKQLAIFVYRII